MSIFQDFLKGLRRSVKAKDSKVDLEGLTYWMTTKERLSEAAEDPNVLVELLGLRTSDEGREYLCFLATADGSGDSKRLAYPLTMMEV